MFSAGTDDQQLSGKLNKLSNSYQLPVALNKNFVLLHSNYNVDNYRNTLFTSTVNLNEKSPTVSTLDLANQSNLIVGQGISNNAGIPLTSVSKIPSYQWSFKHEDHDHSNQIQHKGKNILNGLGTSDSISLLGGTTFNSTALNSKLIRLPLLNEKNQHKKKSLVNGLPYYDKRIIDKQIRTLNLKKAKLNLSVANSSHFTVQFNESVDDIEYLHGEVILNQFLNNKRLLRNYQWYLYYMEKRGGKKLSDGIDTSFGNIKCKTVRQFQKSLERRHKKQQEIQLRRQKEELERQRMNLEAEKKKQLEEKTMKDHSKPAEKSTKSDDDSSSDDSSDDDSSEDDSSEESSSEGEAEEKDEDDDEDEDEDEEDEDEEEEDEKSYTRFQLLDIPVNLNKELIIEKELPIDDKELMEYQNRLFGLQSSFQLKHEAEQTNGIISSKIVRIRRKPNPNALGYSNIRAKKPPYAL
ncbi:hypothetical protein CANARDRAFT_7759 [[Candida] arabinofermentans NRRL YB-2248]|uniref:Uncharacterized protein n=1 Tax=[Candida] arabinofermentans NRRL YB-2248 TaxID=983967 RepID=A0A1E4T016_9ASCO|nr:hypothetical protein CANARDRAFT_7759 [[Candida] arabinofermentans NRRL YB-2248]